MVFTKQMSALCVAALLFAACNTEKKQDAPVVKMDTGMSMQPSAETAKAFTGVAFEGKYDLSCGMPLTAGVSDTAHYKEKIYGFCSSECKAAFVKEPEVLIAQARK